MNKKSVLVQGFAMYITMIGVCYAVPPPIVVETDPNNPLTVQTEEGNPLEVTVVNTAGPAVRIPAQGSSDCDIKPHENICTVMDLISDDRYPEETDTFVFQSLSINMNLDYEVEIGSYSVTVFTDQDVENGFQWHGTVPRLTYFDADDETLFSRSEVVHMIQRKEAASPVVQFKILSGRLNGTGANLRQTIMWSGYFTNGMTE